MAGRRLVLLGSVMAVFAGAAMTPASMPVARAQAAVGFAQPVFVDPVRAGGEPLVIYSHKGNDLVYSSHEGTTHLDRSGATGLDSVAGFFCPGALEPTVQQSCYSNHVWVWTSTDHGKTWTFRDEGAQYTGFSDPDLTEDAGGSIYDTGIDLANDAVFSSQDGGVTWPHGTAQCHSGDRPWLAGGQAGELFMTTDTDPNGHELFHSSTSGDSCDSTGVLDNGNLPASCQNPPPPSNQVTCESYSGFGKGVYDPVDRSFIEPAQFVHPDGSFGVGISRLADAASAFSGGTQTFQPTELVKDTSVYSPFGVPEVLRIDSQENLYFAWDTNDRDANGTNGCSTSIPNAAGGPTAKPNHIMFMVGKHTGPGTWQWGAPIALEASGPARIPGARVLWPWVAVGDPGNVSVVWYQMDQLVDPDCDIASSTGQPAPNVNTYIYEARITNALDAATRTVSVTNASGRAVHQGGICDSGTTCAATGQDRRLGDYFSNSTDAAGCVIIASGDTTVPDAITQQPRITSLPIFIQQNSGPSLTGQDCAAATAGATTGAGTPSPSTPPSTGATTPNTAGVPSPAGPAIALLVGAGLLVVLRRRRKAA